MQSQAGSLVMTSILKRAGLVSSTSQARRLISQGAVRIDGERLEDWQRKISAGEVHVCQVGKRRFAKIKVV